MNRVNRRGQNSRIIIHIDMDAFFAAIEQLDNPSLRGKPVVVGADPQQGDGRGVVSTCSYEARKYGIHSALPISQAYKRCPHAVFLPVRGERYKEISSKILQILSNFTPHIEPISIDEAFMDVSGTAHLFGGKYKTAAKVKDSVYEKSGLTASLGVAPNKFLAKIASDLEKPDGLVFVDQDDIPAFLHPLPVSKLWGVGPKTESFLKALGLKTVGDIAQCRRDFLEQRLGKHGRHLWHLSHGVDDRSVESKSANKSIGHEHTFKEDTGNIALVENKLMQLSENVAFRLRTGGFNARTVCLKIRFEDFETLTRGHTMKMPVNSDHEIFEAAMTNFSRINTKKRKIRLIGVTASGLQRDGIVQTTLFARDNHNRTKQEKWHKLDKTIDDIKLKYGSEALRRGKSL